MLVLSELDIKLIKIMSNRIFNLFSGDIITESDITDAQQQIDCANDKLSVCSAIESMHYCFSVILTEVRQTKRDVLRGIFDTKPDLAKEKSVLEKKLDAEPEYAKYKQIEEYLFQFLEHLTNILNNIKWLVKDEENSIS